MVAAIIFGGMAVALGVGLLIGFSVAAKRTSDALKLARYNDAIALADDLVKTPDALTLRDRAQKILAAHRAANRTES
jgi:hypothetical protein